MSRALALTFLVATLIAGAIVSAQQPIAALQQPPRPQPAFRAGVDVVSLNVTAVDGENRYITDLAKPKSWFSRMAWKQDITFFNQRPRPIALSLLLDSSASMERNMPMLHAAATNFVRRLKPSDLAQVVDFDSRVEILQDSPRTRPTRNCNPKHVRRRIHSAPQRDLYRPS